VDSTTPHRFESVTVLLVQLDTC